MNKRKSKTNKKLIESIISIGILILLIVFGFYYQNKDTLLQSTTGNTIPRQTNQATIEQNKLTGSLEIYFFDVGQADSILLKNQEQTVLIDAGNNADGKWLVQKLENLGIKKIDYLIGTHPHEDHIGGMDDVIKNFDIGTIYMPKVQTNTKTFEEVLDAVAQKNLKITSPQIGMTFNVGDAVCEVMACGEGTKEEKNNLNLASIVIRTTYGKQSYLFMADAETKNEVARIWPQTNVIKIGHHGSDTSSSLNFIKQVQPQIAIISVGKDNHYGHPKESILNRLQSQHIEIYRTDTNGTIYISSDGETNHIQIEK